MFQDAENAFLEKEEAIDERKEEDISETEKVEEERESEDTIISNIKGEDNEYATYHIHMVSDGESVETICTMYNSNLNILQDYNDLSNISTGDKLIIPESNE